MNNKERQENNEMVTYIQTEIDYITYKIKKDEQDILYAKR